MVHFSKMNSSFEVGKYFLNMYACSPFALDLVLKSLSITFKRCCWKACYIELMLAASLSLCKFSGWKIHLILRILQCF